MSDNLMTKLTRPAMVIAILVILIAQFAVLPIIAIMRAQPLIYMPSDILWALIMPVLGYVFGRTAEKITIRRRA